MDRDSDSAKRNKKSSRKDKRPAQKHDISFLLNENNPDERHGDRSKSKSNPSRTSYPSSSTQGRTMPSTSDERSSGYRCSECREDFSNPTALQNHVSRHHRSRTFFCGECPASFSEKGNLNKKQKPWTCNLCGHSFAFRDTLNRHVDAVHRDIRPFPCTECPSKFKKRAHLQRHSVSCHNHQSD